MDHLFNKTPLPFKLALIGFVPLLFLCYLSFRFYIEKSKKVELLDSYINRIHQSADITKLIDNLQREQRYSFEYTLKKDKLRELQLQRLRTDSLINRLLAYKPNLSNFFEYTFLNDLDNTRLAIDSGRIFLTMVMDYYTNVLFRFNTLNALPTGSNIYLEPAYKDLAAQKLLSEMVTYLGIMSSNIYNALYTRQYMVEILMGTRGVHQFFNSYEKEFLMKASTEAAASYTKMRSSSSLHSVTGYLDKLFSKFSFDSTFNASTWEKASSSAIDELRNLQQRYLQNAEQRINAIYESQQRSKNKTLSFLILAFIFSATVIIYSISSITSMLNQLKAAAKKISKGEAGSAIDVSSQDAIASLARSISEIDENNRQLTEAAAAIGKGEFDVTVKPRSDHDLLGNAIVTMKENLQSLIHDLKQAKSEIDALNKSLEKKVTDRTRQLEETNKELEAFSYSVSHDLRAPLRAINGFASILKEDHIDKLDTNALGRIDTIIHNSNMMGQLIDDLIAFSKTGGKVLEKKPVDMKALSLLCTDELLHQEPASKYDIRISDLHPCYGDEHLLKQVWLNLIGNAIKYSSKVESPRIEIRSERQNGCCVYFVRDNGVGFDMKYAHKLFEVFQRLHTEDAFKGTGIGLALVKRIINKHNGRAGAESVPGAGTTFYFTIPC